MCTALRRSDTSKNGYFPAIFPLSAPVQVPEVSITHRKPLGLATVRMGFSTTISLVVLAVLTSEAESIGNLGMVGDLPVILIKGHFSDLASSAQPAPAPEDPTQTAISTQTASSMQVIEAAKCFVKGNVPQQDRADRTMELRRLSAPRATCRECPIRIGSSIGTVAGEDRGTAGLYIKSSIGVRLLTAAHVASPSTRYPFERTPFSVYFPPGGAITSASRLDCILRMGMLLRFLKSDTHQNLQPWLRAAQRICGTVRCGRLGSKRWSTARTGPS